MLTLWCLEQKMGAPKATVALGAPFKGYFPSLHQEGIIFFGNFSYKSFPFYKWTFGAYLIFINVNPLVSGTKKRGPQSNRCFGGPFLWVFSLFAPRGNNFFFSKIFLIKVSHFINEHLEHIWFSLMLTLWCLEQKMGALLWGPLLRVFSLFAPRGNNFFLENISYKSFPFYKWTFGAHLIFINVNPLVSETGNGGPQSNPCFRGPFLGVFFLFCSKRE